jgi:hypothetical protein
VAVCQVCGAEAEAPAAARPGNAAPKENPQQNSPPVPKAPPVRPGPPIPAKNPWRKAGATETTAPRFADLAPPAEDFPEGTPVEARTGAPIAPMMKPVADVPETIPVGDEASAIPAEATPIPAELAEALEAPAAEWDQFDDDPDADLFEETMGEADEAEALALMEAESHLADRETVAGDAAADFIQCGICGFPIDSDGECNCPRPLPV